MMANRSCLAADGSPITEGAYVRLEQARGDGSREISGGVRCFEQDGELRWEVTTDDPQWPAIGFLPEHIRTVR